MEEALNSQSTNTSTGTNWFDLLKSGIEAGAAAAIANNTNKPTATPVSQPVNTKLLLGIGAGVLLLVVALFAFRK